MEQVVLSVELNGRHLKVWKENSHGYNRFYVTPLCIIDTSLINCTKDDYSNEPRYVFSFFVRLWDSLAAETVRLALKQKDIEAKASDILPLPMQMIRLKISNNVRNNIEVDSEWRSNQDQPNTVLFEMYTKSHGFCNRMLQDAKNNPQTFLSRTKLTFEFSMLIGQQTYRNLNITGNTIGKSKAFSNLENNYSNQEGIVYLNSDDMNSLVRNIYQEIAISEEVDSNYIPSNQETQIIEELLGLNLSGSSSDSNSNFKENVENKESDTNDRLALEDIVKFIRKNNANVKWSGTKFEPKGLLLYRLNTRNLKTKGEILYKRIVSTKLTSTQKIEIRPEPKYTTDLKNTISPIYFEENICKGNDPSTTWLKSNLGF
uniref:Uncharacterized protein n=1 Tax=Acrobeloides nanus TaxID=290746 RepID=A0A914DDL0_9BILA